MRKLSEKELELKWKKYTDNIRKSTPIDLNETAKDRAERIKRLEANREEWIKYYFKKFAFAAPAVFQIASTDRIEAAYGKMVVKGFGKFYQSRKWARGLSKSTRRMMELMYLKFVKKFRMNMLLISKSEKNAKKLLDVYRGQLEANQRLIQDYGPQQSVGSWEDGEFTTKDDSSFLAVGRGQSPRGSKNEEMRVNVMVFDDADDDVLCRNKDLLQEAWEWVEQAVMPCVEISKPYFIFFDNNVIAEDALAVRAAKMANDEETINIRDEHGKSMWPQKNTEEMIDLMFEGLSYETIQKEYFNNPMTTGKTFPEVTWGKCPPIKELPFVVVYADPATSNKDRPGQKSNLSNSRKAVFIVGRKGNCYYIYNGFLDVMSNSIFIASFYACRDIIAGQTVAYYCVENNTLQDPFYEQVLLPLVFGYGQDHGNVLPITPDTRKKPEKWFRIEANLEPLNRLNLLVFNEEQKGNPHMLRLESQFKAARPTSKELDGPDCIEGAVDIIKQKLVTNDVGSWASAPRTRSSSKFY